MMQRATTAKTIWTFVSGMTVATIICLGACSVQSQQVEGVYPIPNPSPVDPEDRDGFDPVEQRRMTDRQRIYKVEQGLEDARQLIGRLTRQLEDERRLNRVQLRQINQLQRFTFGIGQSGIGAIGAAGPDEIPTPIGTPPEFTQEAESDE